MPDKASKPRTGTPDPKLEEAQFRRRFLLQFSDPAFGKLREELDRIATVAWDGYNNSRKAPITRKAGPEFADPDYDISVDWLAARESIRRARERHADRPRRPPCC